MIDANYLLNEAERSAGDDDQSRWSVLMALMLDILGPRRTEMPEVAQEALRVADGYWRRGVGRPSDLVRAKVACWRYLDSKHINSVSIIDDEDHLCRALLCVLEPGGDAENLSTIAEWFAEMLNSKKSVGD